MNTNFLEVRVKKEALVQYCGAGGGTGGVVIKLPPGAVITTTAPTPDCYRTFLSKTWRNFKKKGSWLQQFT
jgi:hypothetical protein